MPRHDRFATRVNRIHGESSDMRLLLSIVITCFVSSCATPPVTRTQALHTAWTYTQVEWVPENRHIYHGRDTDGIEVQTPDDSLTSHGFSNGWWKVGQKAKGMPYQWGGFDTPQTFADSLARGEYAGDISTTYKRKHGDAVVSKHATGIDCSGFVSRCWNLPRPVSTRQLPSLCDRLASWDDLKPGDILLNDRHVVLFAGWQNRGKIILAYESGPFPVWRVNAAAIPVAKLLKEGYAPLRYRKIID